MPLQFAATESQQQTSGWGKIEIIMHNVIPQFIVSLHSPHAITYYYCYYSARVCVCVWCACFCCPYFVCFRYFNLPAFFPLRFRLQHAMYEAKQKVRTKYWTLFGASTLMIIIKMLLSSAILAYRLHWLNVDLDFQKHTIVSLFSLLCACILCTNESKTRQAVKSNSRMVEWIGSSVVKSWKNSDREHFCYLFCWIRTWQCTWATIQNPQSITT